MYTYRHGCKTEASLLKSPHLHCQGQIFSRLAVVQLQDEALAAKCQRAMGYEANSVATADWESEPGTSLIRCSGARGLQTWHPSEAALIILYK